MNVYKVLGSQCLHFTTSQQAQRRQTEAVILRGKQVSLGFLRYGKMLTYAPQTWYAEKIVSKPSGLSLKIVLPKMLTSAII